MANLETVKGWMYKKLWGEKSLDLGELIAFIIAALIIWKKPFGGWSIWIALAIIIIAMCLF